MLAGDERPGEEEIVDVFPPNPSLSIERSRDSPSRTSMCSMELSADSVELRELTRVSAFAASRTSPGVVTPRLPISSWTW